MKKAPFITVTEQSDKTYQVILKSELTSTQTWNQLRKLLNNDAFYNEEAELALSELLPYLNPFKELKHRFPDLGQIVNVIEKYQHAELAQLDKMLAENVITFKLLNLYFGSGQKIRLYDSDTAQYFAGLVFGVAYRSSLFGDYLELNYRTIESNGQGYFFADKSVRIYAFEGVRLFSDLPVTKLTPELEEEFSIRGQDYLKYQDKPTHVFCTDRMYVKTYWRTLSYNVRGRLMVDTLNYYRQDSNSYENFEDNARICDLGPELPKTYHYLLPHVVYGFSFVTKRWGYVTLKSLKAVPYRKEAFHQLVLGQETKDLIRTLVQNAKSSFGDIIDGKSGGCIFLLSGPPGTGKTISSESVADYLEKPLYMVSVGELGTEPETLEKKLHDILDLASQWDAVLLLDEADIFLEARTKHDIHRNAMVGIFLRLLEYHQGILFLTTNRVENFDEAFYSRISVHLNYDLVDHSKRAKIWTNLLNAAKLNHITKDSASTDYKSLITIPINGRQVKNSIRLAQCLALDKKRPVSVNDLLRTAKLQKRDHNKASVKLEVKS